MWASDRSSAQKLREAWSQQAGGELITVERPPGPAELVEVGTLVSIQVQRKVRKWRNVRFKRPGRLLAPIRRR